MIGFANNLALSVFVPKEGLSLGTYIAGSVVIGILFLFALTRTPSQYRKPIIVGVVFLTGLFYFLEFMIPGSRETAPARQHLKSAEQSLLTAEKDLNALDLDEKGNLQIGKHDAARRITRARDAMSAAVRDLDRASLILEKLKPEVAVRLARASAEAEAFAKAHNLKAEMLSREGDRPDGRILDMRTSELMKRASDIDRAMTLAGSAKLEVEEAWTALGAVPVANVGHIRAVVSAAADSAAVARTAIGDNFLTPYKEPMGTATAVILGFALFLGTFSLMSIHGKAIVKRRPGWINSLAFYISLVSITTLGFLMKYATNKPGLQKVGESGYNLLFNGGLTALSATMFSLIAFYIVSAAYRAFRIKSGETVLMMLSAFLVMLSFVPFGVWMTSRIADHGWQASFRIENIGMWITGIPNMAAQRGMAFGISVGALAMALRIWLGLERGSYFDKQM